MGGRNPMSEPPLLSPGICMSRKLESRTAAGTSVWDASISAAKLNTCSQFSLLSSMVNLLTELSVYKLSHAMFKILTMGYTEVILLLLFHSRHYTQRIMAHKYAYVSYMPLFKLFFKD